jgi:hypothetical protein
MGPMRSDYNIKHDYIKQSPLYMYILFFYKYFPSLNKSYFAVNLFQVWVNKFTSYFAINIFQIFTNRSNLIRNMNIIFCYKSFPSPELTILVRRRIAQDQAGAGWNQSRSFLDDNLALGIGLEDTVNLKIKEIIQ